MAEKERWKEDAKTNGKSALAADGVVAGSDGIRLPLLSRNQHEHAVEHEYSSKNNNNNNNDYDDDYDDENDDDAVEDQLEEAGIVRAPDGGYGWVVVFASFIANMVVDGVIFSISETIVPLWEREFKSTTSATTVATSLLAGCYLLSGPLGSSLANSFGCNAVAMAGAVIAASGFLLTVIVPALPALYVTFGIIGGIGYGLIFLPAVVIVSQYFSEKRALATGIAVCGSGIGTSLFSYMNPIILRWSNDNWRVFLVVIAGINLACVFVGYFFKPLKPSVKQIEEVTKIANDYIGHRHDSSAAELKKSSAPPALSVASLGGGDTSANGGGTLVETTTSPHVAQGIAIERFERNDSVAGRAGGRVAVVGRGGRVGSSGGRAAGRSRRQLTAADRPFLSTIELHAGRKLDQTKSTSRADLAAEVTKASVADLNRPLSKMDIFYSGSVTSLQKHSAGAAAALRRRAATNAANAAANGGGGGLAAASHEATNRSALYLSTAGLPSSFSDDDDLGAAPRWTRGIVASLRSILDLSLLKSASFLILAVGGFLTLACFFVPFMFIGALAKQNGVDESLSKYLVVILGLVNLAARVICGVIADHPKVDPLVVSNAAVIAGGVATSLAPFCTEFWMFAAYCVPFAFGVACFAALRSVICVELLGIERLTNAYGMLMLFMGVAALIGPPFAALLKNLTNSFYMSFYVMGGLMTLSGLVSLPLRAVSRWEARRGDNVDADAENSAPCHELEPLNPAKVVTD